MGTIDLNGGIHDTSTGQFTGKVQREAAAQILGDSGQPRKCPPTAAESIAKIGFPKDTVAAVLERSLPFIDASINVNLAYDHWEAAKFVQEDWDRITADWKGSDQEMAFLRGFLRHFAPGGLIPDPY